MGKDVVDVLYPQAEDDLSWVSEQTGLNGESDHRCQVIRDMKDQSHYGHVNGSVFLRGLMKGIRRKILSD